METVVIILTRSLDRAARNPFQGPRISNLVETLEPMAHPALVRAGALTSELGLNRCLPIPQGFYPPAYERKRLGIDIIEGKEPTKQRAKDHCESCGITKAEGADVWYNRALDTTLC